VMKPTVAGSRIIAKNIENRYWEHQHLDRKTPYWLYYYCMVFSTMYFVLSKCISI